MSRSNAEGDGLGSGLIVLETLCQGAEGAVLKRGPTALIGRRDFVLRQCFPQRAGRTLVE